MGRLKQNTGNDGPFTSSVSVSRISGRLRALLRTFSMLIDTRIRTGCLRRFFWKVELAV